MTNKEALKFLDEHNTSGVLPLEVKIKCTQALLLAIEIEKSKKGKSQPSTRYSDDNRCVCCGSVIPEGRQICVQCEQSIF